MKLALAAGLLLALAACGGETGGDAPEVTAKVSVAEPIGVATGAGSIWVASFADDAVIRIDPKTERVVARILVGDGPIGVGFGGGSAWSADWSAGTVTRIDPETNRAIATIEVGDGPEGAAWGHGSFWTSNKSGTVSRIDPATNREVARIEVAPELRYLAATSDAVWVASFDDSSCIGSIRARIASTRPFPRAPARRASLREAAPSGSRATTRTRCSSSIRIRARFAGRLHSRRVAAPRALLSTERCSGSRTAAAPQFRASIPVPAR